MPKKYKVLITGSSGMLGVDLSRRLRAGYEVAGLDVVRSSRSSVDTFYPGDVTDRETVSEVIGKAGPGIVIHTAAWTDVDGCELDPAKAYRVNADGAKNVALACRAAGAALIFISTDFVFDGRKTTPYTETDKPGPISVYGDSKLKGEEAVAQTLAEHVILRTSWLYGACGMNFVDTIRTKARTERVLKVVDDQVGSPTYTVDLARAIEALLEKILGRHGAERRAHGVYHVSNAGAVSWYAYAKQILKLAGSKTAVMPISSAELNRPAQRPAMSAMDGAKFRRLTGYRMRSWKSALKEYLSQEE